MTDTFTNYEELQSYNATFTANAYDVRVKNEAAAGKTVVACSDAHYEEAKSYRYNSCTVWDLYSPQTTINTDQLNFQSKSLNTQSTQAVSTLVNSFTRATNLYAVEADSHYTYATTECFTAAPVIVNQASKQLMYGDHLKLQAGKDDQQPVSSLSVGQSYGKLEVGAINDLTLTSENKGVLLNGKSHLSLFTDGDILLDAKQKAAITTKYGFGIKSDGEVAISTGSQLVFSARYGVVINGGGVLSIDGTFINIGGAGSALEPINLDVISLTAQLGQTILDGDLTSLLQIPASISNYSAAFISALPSQISGIIQSQTIPLFNSLTAGNLQNFVEGFGTDQWLENIGGILPANVFSSAAQFGNSLLGAVPFVGAAQQAFNRYDGLNYTFDEYPRLEEIESPEFAPVAEPTPAIVIDGNRYPQFPLPN